jgi:hypothetical protein
LVMASASMFHLDLYRTTGGILYHAATFANQTLPAIVFRITTIIISAVQWWSIIITVEAAG